MKFKYIDQNYPLILASSSPRRSGLLKNTLIPFKSIGSDVREEELTLPPQEITKELAVKKAMSIYKRLSDGWILGADTVVVINGAVLGKPKDKEDARKMLLNLSDRWHRVITGICIVNPGGQVEHKEAVNTDVKIKPLTMDEIDSYVKTGEPMDKAGAYAIQGIGAFMVESIKGSYSNVVGLPIYSLIRALVRTGALRKYPL